MRAERRDVDVDLVGNLVREALDVQLADVPVEDTPSFTPWARTDDVDRTVVRIFSSMTTRTNRCASSCADGIHLHVLDHGVALLSVPDIFSRKMERTPCSLL